MNMMKRYIISSGADGLSIKCNEDGNTRIVKSNEELSMLVAKFIGQGYLVKRYDDHMALCGGEEIIRINSYKAMDQNPVLARLKRDIPVTIKRSGYIDKRAIGRVQTKPNRQKSKKYGGTVIAGGLATVSLMSAILSFSLRGPVEHRSIESYDNVSLDDILIVEDVKEKSSEEADAKFEEDFTYELAQPIVQDETVDLSYFLEDEAMELDEDKTIELPIASNDDVNEAKVSDQSHLLVAENKCFLPIPNLFNEDKAINARNQYGDLMVKVADDFGLDSEMLLAVGTQERAVHSSIKDPGGGIGLMQVQYSVWIDKTINVLKKNPMNGEFEPYSIYVTDEKLQSLEGNIEIGAAILQTCLKYANYNIPLAIQMYNQGSGSMEAIVDTYCQISGKDYRTVWNDPNDIGWFDYCDLKPGDPEYLINVNKWIENRNFKVLNVYTGEEVAYSFVDSNILSEVRTI